MSFLLTLSDCRLLKAMKVYLPKANEANIKFIGYTDTKWSLRSNSLAIGQTAYSKTMAKQR